MKGIKDFLIMYFLCVIVLLIAATVLSGVKGGFWSLLLFGAFLVTLLFACSAGSMSWNGGWIN